MKHWKSILLLVLVFVTGIVVGAVGTRAVTRHFVRLAINQPERVQGMMERSLERQLRLDQSQRARLHDILTDSRIRLRDLRQEYQPQMAIVISNANAQINGLLSPGQQAAFEKYKESNAWLIRPLRPPLPRPAP
jgi:hypothetical protein